MLFVDSGPFGRMPSLQPVTWEVGWPMVGVEGRGVVTYRKPNIGKEYPVKEFPRSDEFDSSSFGMQWGWNHNPDSTKWSLTERKGFLRLYTASVVDRLPKAVNTLTQRPFSHYDKITPSLGTAKIDVANMKDGDIAGVGIFQDPYAYIAVKQTEGKKELVMVNNGQTISSVSMSEGNEVYLRAIASNSSKIASFEYSFDNENYTALGNELRMQFNLKMFTGNKFCLFNYATSQIGGYIDIDWFRVK